MPKSLPMPVPRRTPVPRMLLKLILVAVGLLAMSLAMSPRQALAEETYHRYHLRLDVRRPGETATGWTDWIHPSETREFTADELWWPVYSVLGTSGVHEIIATNGLAGEHPAGGTQETIELAGGKGTVRYTSSMVGTLKVSDGEHGTGSVVSDIGPVGEVATPNIGVFAERVHLSATPDAGYEFDSWEILSDDFGLRLDSYYDPNTWLNIGGVVTDIDIKPVFRPLPTQPVTVTDDGHGTGSASMAEAWAGATVTLSATPSDGWEFDRWEVLGPEGLAIDGDSFTMGDEPVTIKAMFRKAAEVTPQGEAPSEGNGMADGGTTGDAVPGNPAEAPARDGQERQTLPATGDKVVPIAIGIIATAGVCIAAIMCRRP